MSYHHLTTYERSCIEKLHKLGYSNRQIALNLNRHHATIDRELKRNKATVEYEGHKAQDAYLARRKNSRPQGKYSKELVGIIEEKFQATWPTEQIANTATLGQVSCKTIYNWLYQGKLYKADLSVLRHKGKRRKPDEKRGKFTIGTLITQRPKAVKKRASFGH